MDPDTKDSEKHLSEADIREGFRLAGLGSDDSMESFRNLRRLADLSALAHPSPQKVQRHSTSHTPLDSQNG